MLSLLAAASPAMVLGGSRNVGTREDWVQLEDWRQRSIQQGSDFAVCGEKCSWEGREVKMITVAGCKHSKTCTN